MNKLHPKARRVGRFEHDSEAWHQARRNGIGGSDAPVILETSDYKTPRALFDDKMGRTAKPFTGNDYTYVGQRLEDSIREIAFGGEALDGGKLGSLQNIEHPFLVANIDGVLPGDIPTLIEIKTAARKWSKKTIPQHYQDQMQHYMLVTGLERAIAVCCEVTLNRPTLARLLDDDLIDPLIIVKKYCQLHTFPLEASKEWQEEYLPLAEKFWTCIETDTWSWGEEPRYAF